MTSNWGDPILIQDEVKNNNPNDFSNIQNIADIPHKAIKQPNPNEFIIKKKIYWSIVIIMPLLSCIIIAGIICLYLFDIIQGEYREIGVFIAIAFLGFIFIMGLYGFFCQIINVKILLEDYSIRVVRTLICCCFNKTNIIKSEDVKKFDLEYFERNSLSFTSIIYIDQNENRKTLVSSNFFGNEAKYLVYVLNKHFNITKNENTYFHL